VHTYIYDPTTGEIKPVDVKEYAEWSRNWPDARRIEETTIGDCWISTVFLGIDHRYGADGPPVLFETMVFWDGHKDIHNDYMRCCTIEEANHQHAEMCTRIEKYIRDLNEDASRVDMWPEKSDDESVGDNS
jgi:hypothetical protein